MSNNRIYLLAGLGNPGREYARTRHNIGFLVLDALASQAAMDFKINRFTALCAKGNLDSHRVILAKPQAYMNRSGAPLQQISSYYKISPPDLIVVHDDLDLPFGRIRIAQNRGHGGHNGIRSIIDAFGSKAFCRVRVGVGRPPRDHDGAVGHVLGKFSSSELKTLDELVKRAADACVSVMDVGVAAAMNNVNSSR